MLSDYYKALTKRVVTQVTDGAGGFTETTVDSTIYGFIAVLKGFDLLVSKQLNINADARLFTTEVLNVSDRIIDGTAVYQILFPYDDFHKWYEMKRYE